MDVHNLAKAVPGRMCRMYLGQKQLQGLGESYSAYRAQHGGYPEYCNNMDTIMYRDVDLSRFDVALLDFYLWLETESGYECLQVSYYDSGVWNWDHKTDSDTTGWEEGSAHFATSIAVPTTATRVAFRFTSEGSTTYEGAYIDNVELRRFRTSPCGEEPVEVGGIVKPIQISELQVTSYREANGVNIWALATVSITCALALGGSFMLEIKDKEGSALRAVEMAQFDRAFPCGSSRS